MSALEKAFAEVMRTVASRGVVMPPALESMCRTAFFAGAVEAAALISRGDATPLDISSQFQEQLRKMAEPRTVVQ